jgi:hypothetical protein
MKSPEMAHLECRLLNPPKKNISASADPPRVIQKRTIGRLSALEAAVVVTVSVEFSV